MDWPKELVEDLAKRKCVLFLGSGVSMGCIGEDGTTHPLSWADFIKEGIDLIRPEKQAYKDEAEKCLTRLDFLMANEIVKNGLGKDAFISLLKDKFVTPKFSPSKLHEYVFELDARIVITPNFDKIYDTLSSTQSHGTTVIKTHTSDDIIDCIRRDEPLVIKMHGSIDSPSSLIFTKKDYAEAWNRNSKIYHTLEALILTHTFLFLGCGLSDPDITMLLERFNFNYGTARSHLFVIPKEEYSDITLNIISETRNIKFLKYSSVDEHAELEIALSELVKLVEATREKLSIR